MNTFEYHQLLKYIYFEGYADSYEDAEYLLEELNDDEYEELCEKFVKAMDNGSEDNENVNENLEINNIIIDYLLDEGYTDTLESAQIILENMSDAWFDIIIDEKFIPISHDKARRMKNRSSNITQQSFNTRYTDPEKSKTLQGKKSLIDAIRRDMYSRRLKTDQSTGKPNPEYDDLIYKQQVAHVKGKEKSNKQKRKR